jgi:hypothetical protein
MTKPLHATGCGASQREVAIGGCASSRRMTFLPIRFENVTWYAISYSYTTAPPSRIGGVQPSSIQFGPACRRSRGWRHDDNTHSAAARVRTVVCLSVRWTTKRRDRRVVFRAARDPFVRPPPPR